VAEHTSYAVCMHFDSASGMVYEGGQNLEWRRAKTVRKPEWWAGRLKLLKQLVFPALARQKWQEFTTWCLFDKRDEDLNGDVLKFCVDAGAKCTYRGPSALREHYLRGNGGMAMKWLVVVHQDSDDLYGPEALLGFACQKPAEGQVWHYDTGYIFGLDVGRLAEFNANSGGPPPFHAMCYTRNALVNGDTWKNYRRTWNLGLFHHQLLAAKNVKRLAGRQFCVLVHDSNTTTGWNNPHTARHTARELTDQKERHTVCADFGLANWKE